MTLDKTFQALRRQFFLRAHDTKLWASYLPRIPNLVYGLAIVGIALLVAAFISPIGNGGKMGLLIIGILLCIPLPWLAVVVQQRKERRAVVRKWILDTVPWRGDEQVLDVGCGTGMLLNGAAARLTTGTATGIDLWVAHGGGGNYDLLMKHARMENVADRIRFQQMDALKMTFQDESFDVVLSSWAMHHITRSREDFDTLSQEMIRVIKPGGMIVVVDVPHFLEAFAMRTENAGLKTELRDFNEHKMLVGRKLANKA